MSSRGQADPAQDGDRSDRDDARDVRRASSRGLQWLFMGLRQVFHASSMVIRMVSYMVSQGSKKRSDDAVCTGSSRPSGAMTSRCSASRMSRPSRSTSTTAWGRGARRAICLRGCIPKPSWPLRQGSERRLQPYARFLAMMSTVFSPMILDSNKVFHLILWVFFVFLAYLRSFPCLN